MRLVAEGVAPIDDAFVDAMATCVQCRGCEPACPSGVPYGRLQEATRAQLATSRVLTPRWQRVAMRSLGHRRLLLAASTLLAVAQRLRLVPRRQPVPQLALRRGPRPVSTGTDAWLFTGCVMDAWQRQTHRSTATVLARLGIGVQVSPGGCCGALHVHAGLDERARALARATMAAMPGSAPIVVNSAGCGAALQDYGHLLGDAAAAAFSARVVDVHEFVAAHLERLGPQRHLGPVVVHDPCHLRHVQRAHLAVRAVLGAVADVVELPTEPLGAEGLCCGAGGAFAALQPTMADAIRERTVAAVRATGVATVASANPGCIIHLSRGLGDVRVAHPIDLLASAL